MKEKIIEMLRNRTQASENLNDGLRGQAIYEYEFDYLADEIVKLFRQPAVMQRSELLLAFIEHIKKDNELTETVNANDVDSFLKSQQ